LAAAEREAGVLEERQRLAREIHDTLAQGFTSIVMLLEAAEAEIGSDQAAAARHLDQARRTARESLGEARGVVWALQPEALERTSLPEAIGRIAHRLQEETGVMARSMVTGTPRQLPRQAETALLRAAQEGLANVRKHARAKEVVLTLSYVADRVILDRRRQRLRSRCPGRRAPEGEGLRVVGHAGTRGGTGRHAHGGERTGTGHLARRRRPYDDARPARLGRTASRRTTESGGRGARAVVIRILIADDHPVVRTGLQGMLAGEGDFEVVGEARDGKEAVKMAARLKPDVVLMDLRMPVLDGVAATELIRAGRSETEVLILTTYDTDGDILRALDAGAVGCMIKDSPREELFRAVRAAARGESVLAPAVLSQVMSRMRAPAAETLSDREVEVLRLVARGASNKEAARELFISETTVKTHLSHIFTKLGVDDRTAAVTVALDRGILRMFR
jgi:DNA-binding NarL/FixJ family response regulator